MRNYDDFIGDSLPTKTGITPVDKTITRTLEFEKSYLGNPFIQIAILGLAGYGVYRLIAKNKK
mgnify:CR=1 FL=1